MRILFTLTYYLPHISGLTIFAQRLARRLVEDGHEVTILTSRFTPDLPRRERTDDGVDVVRSRVLFRVSKGTMTPLLPWDAARLVASHDIVHVVLPQIEGSGIAVLAKLMRKPVVSSYLCDIELPPGMARALFTPAIRGSHYVTGKLSDRIVVLTESYGRSARLPRRFQQKVSACYPPVELAAPGDGALRARIEASGGPLVGFVGRFSEEKGIAVLLDAAPEVMRALPEARFVAAGQTQQVPGERVYERLLPKMQALGDRFTHVGVLSDSELREFYEAVDVLVLPSINSTESFGMTQVEAMLAGTPVVASDLPGVREAVDVTGMGKLAPPGDAPALGAAIVDVLSRPEQYIKPHDEIAERFSPERTARFYADLFEELRAHRHARTGVVEPAPVVVEPSEPEPVDIMR